MTTIEVGPVSELADPGCREFSIGGGDWPLTGFIVRKGEQVFAYQNKCMHVGHPLNWRPDNFLTKDGDAIICASHGAMYSIETGKCFAGPCKGKGLRKISVEVRGGVIFVRGPERVDS